MTHQPAFTIRNGASRRTLPLWIGRSVCRSILASVWRSRWRHVSLTGDAGVMLDAAVGGEVEHLFPIASTQVQVARINDQLGLQRLAFRVFIQFTIPAAAVLQPLNQTDAPPPPPSRETTSLSTHPARIMADTKGKPPGGADALSLDELMSLSQDDRVAVMKMVKEGGMLFFCMQKQFCQADVRVCVLRYVCRSRFVKLTCVCV